MSQSSDRIVSLRFLSVHFGKSESDIIHGSNISITRRMFHTLTLMVRLSFFLRLIRGRNRRIFHHRTRSLQGLSGSPSRAALRNGSPAAWRDASSRAPTATRRGWMRYNSGTGGNASSRLRLAAWTRPAIAWISSCSRRAKWQMQEAPGR
jgi:hypothetical protein